MKIVIDMQGAQANALGSTIDRHAAVLISALTNYNAGEHHVHLAFSGQIEIKSSGIINQIRDVIRPTNVSWWYAPTTTVEQSDRIADLNIITNEIYTRHLLSLLPDIVIVTDSLSSDQDRAITRPSDQLLSQVPVVYLLDNPAPRQLDSIFADHQERLGVYLEWISRLTHHRPTLSISELVASGYPQPNSRSSNRRTIKNIDILATKEIRSTRQSDPPKHLVLFSTSQDFTSLNWALKTLSLLPSHIRRQLRIDLCTPARNTPSIKELVAMSGLSPSHISVCADSSSSKLHEIFTRSHALIILDNALSNNESVIIDALDRDIICAGQQDSGILNITGCTDTLIDRERPESFRSIVRDLLTDDSYCSQVLKKQQAYSKRSGPNRLANATLEYLNELIARHDQAIGKASFIHYTGLSAASDLCHLSATRSADAIALSNCIAHSFARSSLKKCLFIDISSLVKADHKTGIQRVVRAILKNLIHATPCDWEVVAVYADEYREGYFVDGKVSGSIEGFKPNHQTAGQPAAFRSGDILLVLDLNHGVALYQEEFLLLLRSRGISVYFTVYDILPVLMPQYFLNGSTLSTIHSRWLRIIARMDGYFAISESVRDELNQWYKDNDISLPDWYCQSFFHLGADLDGSIPSKGMPDNYKEILGILKQRPSFVQVSTIEPRKGYEQILDAFELLWRDGHDINLVFVGKQGWLVDGLIKRLKKHPELGSRLLWLQGISDEMLGHVYSACACCIMASYGEGFGLPLVEAAQKGLPIIARNIPVFKEITGGHAFFFDANTGAELAEAISLWLEQYTNNKHTDSKEIPWLSWRESANQVMQGLLTAYAGDPRSYLK